MQHRSRRRPIQLLVLACLVAAASCLVAPSADAAVVVDATPSANLTATTLIDVTVSGLGANAVVRLAQCGPAGCDMTGTFTADGSGNVAAKFVARPVVTAYFFDPYNPPTVDCRVVACTIDVRNAGTFALLGSTPVTFTPDADPTKPPFSLTPSNLQNGQATTVSAPVGALQPKFPGLTIFECLGGGFPFPYFCSYPLGTQGQPTPVTNGGDGSFSVPFTVADTVYPMGLPPYACNGTGCVLVITAQSPYGGGLVELARLPITLGSPPPVPDVPSGVPAGVGKVTATTELPSQYPGDATVTVTASPGGQSCQFTAPSGSSTTPRSCTISGLSDGTTYDIAASASSVFGSSVSSASSQVTTVSTGTITGLVRNTAKRPLPGMLVLSTSDGSTMSGVAVTAADGTFSMTVAVGDHKVAAIDLNQFNSAPDFYLSEFYDNAGASDVADATVVSVSAGNASALNTITLDYNHPGSVSGVVDDGSTGLPGMLTVLLQDDNPTPFALAITAADGSFTIGNVPPGTYKLVTIDMAYGSPSYYIPEFYDNGGSTAGDFATAQTIVVTTSTDTPLNTISLDHTP